jgi:hypothetical protein
MDLADPAEVIAVYGKGDGQGKQPGFAHQRLDHLKYFASFFYFQGCSNPWTVTPISAKVKGLKRA